MLKKILLNVFHPRELIKKMIFRNIIKVSDKKYLELKFEAKMGKKLDLKAPKTFNEKLQWLKLYDRNLEYTKMVDKYEAKKYVSNIIGEEYIIPTLGIYDNFDEIDFDALPNQFVMKCTHDSGGVVICKNKSVFNKKESKIKLNKSLKTNFYYESREWPYKNVKPRIIVEEFMGENLNDYRIWCFNGKAKYIYMYFSKAQGSEKPEPEFCNIYDINWNLQEFHQRSLPKEGSYEKPEQLEKMIKLAERLSKNTKYLRVDFYIINNKIYFSEMTFFPGGGFSRFYPEEYDKILGDMIELPHKESI